MGQGRHGSATTTQAARAAIQRSQAEDLPAIGSGAGRGRAELNTELGINPGTVAKWHKRATVEDRKTGPAEPRSTAMTEAEEATVVAFRRHILLPPGDCLYARQSSLPDLTRSALHRCLQHHGMSRLPDVEGDKPKRQKFKRNPISFFHSDIAEVQTAEGKLHLLAGLDPIHQMPGLNTWRRTGTGAWLESVQTVTQLLDRRPGEPPLPSVHRHRL